MALKRVCMEHVLHLEVPHGCLRGSMTLVHACLLFAEGLFKHHCLSSQHEDGIHTDLFTKPTDTRLSITTHNSCHPLHLLSHAKYFD